MSSPVETAETKQECSCPEKQVEGECQTPSGKPPAECQPKPEGDQNDAPTECAPPAEPSAGEA